MGLPTVEIVPRQWAVAAAWARLEVGLNLAPETVGQVFHRRQVAGVLLDSHWQVRRPLTAGPPVGGKSRTSNRAFVPVCVPPVCAVGILVPVPACHWQ